MEVENSEMQIKVELSDSSDQEMTPVEDGGSLLCDIKVGLTDKCFAKLNFKHHSYSYY